MRREGAMYPFLLSPVETPVDNDGRRFQHFMAIPVERCRIVQWMCHGPQGTDVATLDCAPGSVLDAGETCNLLVSWPRPSWWRRLLERWRPTARPQVAAKVQVTADTPGRLSEDGHPPDYWIPDESES